MSLKYADKPALSKKKINKAADIVARGKFSGSSVDDKTIEESRKIVDSWRVAHTYPLKVFETNLRRKTKNFNGSVVAQRLKRMPTILDKLGVREKNMDYTNMQDLGGVRAILKLPNEVNEIAQKYLKSKSRHILKSDDDYVLNPRPSGYRGRHLVYKYMSNSDSTKQYNGLMIEIQIRTYLQHIWATGVETMSVVTEQDLKSSNGEQKILNFFKYLSVAFAHTEKTTIPLEYSHLSELEVYKKVALISKDLHILQKLKAYIVATNNPDFKLKNGHYLLELDAKERRVKIRTFKDSNQANEVYKNRELATINQKHIDIVLVSVKKHNELRKAYPNYFVDSIKLIEEIERIEKKANKNDTNT